MPWLRFTMRSGHYLLLMRQVHAAARKASTVEQGKIRRPVNSRLRHQKESYPRCARHGPSVRQTMYHKAHDMLRKARKHKSGGYKTNLERWHDDEKHRKSLSDIGWTEEQIIQYDEIASEDHSCVATRQERGRNDKSWKISLNSTNESAQWLFLQRSTNAKGCMTNTQESLEKETNPSLLHHKSGNGLIKNLKASKNTTTDLNLVQDGDSTHPPGRRIHLRHRTGSRTSTGSQIEDSRQTSSWTEQ